MIDARIILLLCMIVNAQDYINLVKEFNPIKGSLLGTVNVLRKEYTVSFNVKPIKYSKVWENVLRLSLGSDFVVYGDTNPGVWFNGDGSGRIRIHAAINGDKGKYFDILAPLDLGQWSSIKIYQNKYEDIYWFSVDINGVNVLRVKNSDACDVKNMKVYASDPWYPAKDCFISNLLVVNGNDNNDYFVLRSVFNPIQGSLLKTLNVLKKEYTVSFSIKPIKYSRGWKNVLHLTLGNNYVVYGDVNPGVFFIDDGSGRLRINAAINGAIDKTFDTAAPLELDQWSSIKIYQYKYEGIYWFAFDINGVNIVRVKNSDARDFYNMKVYASDPWHDAQDCFISNLLIINKNGDSRSEQIDLFNSDYVDLKKEFNPIQGSLLGTLSVLKKEYTVSFSVKPITYSKGWKNIIRLTLGNDFLVYGDANPGVWFHEDGSGRIRVHASVNSDRHYYIDTNTTLDLGQWSSIKIYQIKYEGMYWFSVDVNGVNILKVINSDAQDFKNMKVYASDPWYSAPDAFISNLLIINGNGYMDIKKGLKLIQGSLLGTMDVLRKAYTVSFNVKPIKYSMGRKNVLRLTLGNNYVVYGDPGVFFIDDGRLRISAAINGAIDQTFDTAAPLELGQWSSIKIYQYKYEGIYWFAFDINGVNIVRVKNSDARDFNNMKVYASDPWNDAPECFISNLLIINGNDDKENHQVDILNSDYIDLTKEFKPIRGSLLGKLKVLKKEYTVSFSIKPIKYSRRWKNVLHLTLGDNYKVYGDVNPGVFFIDDGSGRLRINAAINGAIDKTFDTAAPLELDQWSSIKIYQYKYEGIYWFAFDINGVNIVRVKNSDPRDFYNMKVYASDPWHDAQDCFISNLFIINGNYDYIDLKESFNIIQGSLLGTLNDLRKEYTVSFYVKPISFSLGLKNVLRLSLGNNFLVYGDANPGVSFHGDGSGRLRIHASINGNINHYFDTTTPLNVGQWSSIKIHQNRYADMYWFSVYVNGVNIYSVKNSDARDFKNMKVYASDPWYAAQDCFISNLLIFSGNNE